MREIIAATQADSDAGKQSDPFCCPVAQAMKRQYPGRYPQVGRFQITMGRWGKAVPSRRMERWIRRFDLGKPVQPARFAVSWED